MITLFWKGGPLMILIGLCSVIAVAVFLERIFHFRRAQIDTEKFMSGMRNLLKKKSYIEALSICEETPGPVAAVLKAGILKHDKGKEAIQEALQNTSHYEIPRLEKNLFILSTVAQISPLIGLLGTVTGMINAFMKIQEKAGFVNPGDLAQGIWQALITTAGGLVVAIPAFVAYNYLVYRVTNFVVDMEKASTELVELLANEQEEEDIVLRPSRGRR